MDIEVAPVWEGLLGGIEHMKLQTCRGDGAKMAQRKQQRHEENLKVKTNKPAWCGVAMWLRALMVGSQEGQWLDETFPPRNPAPPRGQQGFQTALPGQAHPEERPGAPAPWGPSGVYSQRVQARGETGRTSCGTGRWEEGNSPLPASHTVTRARLHWAASVPPPPDTTPLP